MGVYRKEWLCCNSVTETDSWEPDNCPFCTPDPAATPAEQPAKVAMTVDTPEFRELMAEWFNHDDAETAYSCVHYQRIIAHIHAWAARSNGDAPLYSTRQDAERFRRAIALDDNAEALYAAVLSHAPDAIAIRRAFDAATRAPDKDRT